MFAASQENPGFELFDQVRHKPGCTTTEGAYWLEISTFGSRGIVLSCSEKKGADQLRGYRAAW